MLCKGMCLVLLPGTVLWLQCQPSNPSSFGLECCGAVSGALWAVVRAELCGVGLDLLGARWDDGDAGWLWSCREPGRP